MKFQTVPLYMQTDNLEETLSTIMRILKEQEKEGNLPSNEIDSMYIRSGLPKNDYGQTVDVRFVVREEGEGPNPKQLSFGF